MVNLAVPGSLTMAEYRSMPAAEFDALCSALSSLMKG